jgi:hypothetical protein
MGIPDGAHTHGGGGGFDPMPLLIILGAVLIAGPVLAGVAAIVHVLVIVVEVLVAVAGAGLVAYVAYRVRRWRSAAARTTPPLSAKVVRAMQPLPKVQRPRELPAGLQGQTPGELHLHFHGLTPEDVAAILARQTGRDHG